MRSRDRGGVSSAMINFHSFQQDLIDQSDPHRKIPVISPRPIQLHKGFGWAYKRGGLYLGGKGRRGLMRGKKELIIIKLRIKKKHHQLVFSVEWSLIQLLDDAINR